MPCGASAADPDPEIPPWPLGRPRLSGDRDPYPGQFVDGLWTEVCGQQKQSNNPGNNQHNPQYANYWAPLMRKWHIPPHPAQS